MADDRIHDDVDELAATMTAWRASVPKAVGYAQPAEATDAATAAVLAAMADWPAEHATMGAHRESLASSLHTATGATTTILAAADDEGAVGIRASGG
ncbi:hypothetical protein MOKP64_44950 [Mycobacterium avium subsp. hominissuis]